MMSIDFLRTSHYDAIVCWMRSKQAKAESGRPGGDGVLAVIAAFQIRKVANHWWVVLLEGLAGILVGIIALVYPLLTAGALLLLIAFWAVFTGLMEIIAAIRLRREINNEWSLILSGVLSVILGIVLVAFPSAGALGLIWAIGIYAILFGVLMLYLAFKVRGFSHRGIAPAGEHGNAFHILFPV